MSEKCDLCGEIKKTAPMPEGEICKECNSKISRETGWKTKEKSVPVSELDVLIDWGLLMQANNKIYTKTVDELNEDWIEKIKELKLGLSEKKEVKK